MKSANAATAGTPRSSARLMPSIPPLRWSGVNRHGPFRRFDQGDRSCCRSCDETARCNQNVTPTLVRQSPSNRSLPRRKNLCPRTGETGGSASPLSIVTWSECFEGRRIGMQAETRTLNQLFQLDVRYAIPLYQRPYVWTRDKQWDPLWEDISTVAEHVFTDGASASSPSHFLGAIVIQQEDNPPGTPQRFLVIDG